MKGDMIMKKYVVYGAATPGFGEQTARTLIEHGNIVIGLFEAADAKNAECLQKEFGSSIDLRMIDICDYNSLRAVVESIDEAIDGFVSAAFTFDMDNIDDFDFELVERLFRANYHGPMYLAVELKKKMVSESSVVFVTSTESDRGSFGGISYAASKAAVHNMIKSLSCNWGKKEKIRANAVAAGWIGGEMDNDGPFEVSMNITPLGRLGTAKEVADAVEFLLSEKASFVNASVLYVDGGYLAVDDIAKYEYEASKG